MNISKRNGLGAIIFVLLVTTFGAGFYFGNSESTSRKELVSIAGAKEGKPSDVDFSAFWKVWNVLNDKFAGTSTPDKDKVWGAIKGLTASENDPYTVFFPPKESKMFQDEISGNFEGVGMEVGLNKDGKIVVVTPIKDTPAEKAGIKSGDRILKIDDTSTEGLAIDQAIGLIRGKAGTEVIISVGRDGLKTLLEIRIIRAVIDIPTIRTGTKRPGTASSTASAPGDTGLRSDGIFTIALYSFSANSANLFRNALKEFIASKSHKLIIDLRGNPGGYLDSAIDMASWFLPSGKIVVKEVFGKEKEDVDYRSKGYNIFTDKLKLVILVNGGSASASEILAGALSEHGIARLVGQKTFGKGSVQELINITEDTSLKVTIANWLTPRGVSISKQGIIPDYVVSMTDADIKAGKDLQMDKAVELLSKEN